MRISDWSSDVCSSDLNADITVIGERPKIGPYREQIRTALADMLGVARLQVSVKATTTEGLGFEGRREGIPAQAVVLLVRARLKRCGYRRRPWPAGLGTRWNGRATWRGRACQYR